MSDTKLAYFGKLPCAGDFVQFNLPGSMSFTWDKWLQNSVLATQQSLGEHWLDYYLVAPWWRFVLMPSIVNEQGWLGLWCPSVDKVGRYFPFTLMHPLESNVSPMEALLHNGVWYEELEALVSKVLDQTFDFDQFRSEFLTLQAPDLSRLRVGDMGGLSSDVPHTAAGPFQVTGAYVSLLLHRLGAKQSFWWTEGSTWVRPKMISCDLLPKYQGFTAFIDGKWQQWGWQG